VLTGRQFLLDVDLDLYMTMGAVASVTSPSHPVTFTPSKSHNSNNTSNRLSGKIKLLRDAASASAGPSTPVLSASGAALPLPQQSHVLQDLDFVIRITMTDLITRLLPKCYVESNEGTLLLLIYLFVFFFLSFLLLTLLLSFFHSFVIFFTYTFFVVFLHFNFFPFHCFLVSFSLGVFRGADQ
jgi:hypothetical protein